MCAALRSARAVFTLREVLQTSVYQSLGCVNVVHGGLSVVHVLQEGLCTASLHGTPSRLASPVRDPCACVCVLVAFALVFYCRSEHY